MIQITPQMRILLSIKAVDFRKGIDGLAGVCRHVKSGTLVQRQLINADDSVLIIFRITIHLFFGRSNSPSSSS